MFRNKTILITGGTGSLGNELVDRLVTSDAKKIIIYSRDEFKQWNMAQRFQDDRLRFFIGDVRDYTRLWRACTGVDYIIHAAAMKQVPACEYNPIEAVKTNVTGAMNVINAALDRGVEKVVALSSDKAVNPVNLYGATKLCSDKLMINANAYSGQSGTLFAVVRYGNVAHSRGGVIPMFKRLAEGGVKMLPVTDTRMTRFHITLKAAANMVITAFERMRGGELYVAKLPSYRITDLVDAFGLEAEIIGIRPGEKLHEVMITSEDSRTTYEYGNHYIIYPQFDWWDTRAHFTPGGVLVGLDFCYSSDKNTEWMTVDELREAIH